MVGFGPSASFPPHCCFRSDAVSELGEPKCEPGLENEDGSPTGTHIVRLRWTEDGV